MSQKKIVLNLFGAKLCSRIIRCIFKHVWSHLAPTYYVIIKRLFICNFYHITSLIKQLVEIIHMNKEVPLLLVVDGLVLWYFVVYDRQLSLSLP